MKLLKSFGLQSMSDWLHNILTNQQFQTKFKRKFGVPKRNYISTSLVADIAASSICPKPLYPRHWIKTDISALAIAESLGLHSIHADSENYWEWAIGIDVQTQQKIDIYRVRQTLISGETQIFLTLWHKNGLQKLSGRVEQIIIEKLLDAGHKEVYFGDVYNDRHNEFSAIETKEK